MKNLKKVLALVLACTMVFGLVATAAGTGYPDVAEDATYAEAVKTLSALGIIQGDENGNFNPDATITRAEMAKILCTMINSGEISPTATKFTDVADNHWASGYINYAQQLGYIDGYDDTTFGPEDPVTYEQVVKLIMCALDYRYMAEENGGYPAGYLFVAASAEVTDRAPGNGPEAAPRSTVAMLVNNAMNAPIMERTSYGTESVWEVQDGTGTKAFKSLLTLKHKTYKVEGKVTKSYKQDSSMRDGYVNVDITRTLKIDVENVLDATPIKYANSDAVEYYMLNNVNAAGTDAADMVGYASVMYFKELDTGDIGLVAIARKSARNNEVVISDVSQAYDPDKDSSVRDSDKPTLSGDTKKFAYWNDRDSDSRITTIELDGATDVYWNNGAPEKLMDRYQEYRDLGYTDEEATVAAIVPERGSITFVDTANNGIFDMIRVTSYDVAIVDGVDEASKTINFKNEKSISMMDNPYVTLTDDEYPNLKEYSITLDGAAIDVGDLQEFDVLSIATNDWTDPTFFDIIVTRNVVSGAVSEVNDADNYVVIGGERYEITDGMLNLALPELEDEGNFYLDAEGKIAYIDTTSSVNGNFAYMYRTGLGTFDEKYLRIFTKDSEDVNFSISDRIRINDVRKDTLDDPYTWTDIADIYDMTETELKQIPGLSSIVMTDTVKVGDIFDGIDEGANPALTPYGLIDTIVKGTNTLKADFALTGNKDADKFITYTANSEQITEITLAIPTSNTDTFGYVGSVEGAEWQASLNKFKNSMDLADNAVIFFVDSGANATIEDFQVKTVADLNDGNKYDPFFFAFTNEGVSAALVLSVESTLGSNLAVFDSYTRSKAENGDDVYNVTYWTNGALAEAPLVADAAEVGNDITSMRKGDAFVYGQNDQGRVNKISVIFKPGTTQPLNNGSLVGASFNGMVSIAGLEDDYEIMGSESATGDADNQVYFGYVGKTATVSNGLRVTLVNETGSFSGANQQSIIIPDSGVNILYYNPTMAEAKKIQGTTRSIITPSFFQSLSNGDMNLETTQPQHMRYAFVRVQDDVVTDVIYVRYSN